MLLGARGSIELIGTTYMPGAELHRYSFGAGETRQVHRTLPTHYVRRAFATRESSTAGTTYGQAM